MSPLSLPDLPRFKSAIRACGKRVWCYYFPFLLSYSLPPDRPLVWDSIGNSLCLWVRRRTREGDRIDLMFPPVPWSEEATRACVELAASENPDGVLRVLWADEEDADRLRREGFEVAFKEEEYLYSPSAIAAAEGRPYRDLRKRVARFQREHPHTYRRMTVSDREGCDVLLRLWRRVQGRKRPFLLDWGYTRAALGLVGGMDAGDLSAWVVEIDGQIRAFAMAGEMGEGLANFFVIKGDPSVRGLSDYLRWRVCGEIRGYDRVNDASDLDLPGLRQSKMKFRPSEMLGVHSARLAIAPRLRV